MDNNETPELTDMQIMLIMKAALEYNAEIVRSCSFIYGQDIKQSSRKRLYSDFTKLARDYGKTIESILKEES